MHKPRIKVRIQNGAVKEVRGIPEHYVVQVLDYDSKSEEAGTLSEDDNHKPVRISEWPKATQSPGSDTSS